METLPIVDDDKISLGLTKWLIVINTRETPRVVVAGVQLLLNVVWTRWYDDVLETTP